MHLQSSPIIVQHSSFVNQQYFYKIYMTPFQLTSSWNPVIPGNPRRRKIRYFLRNYSRIPYRTCSSTLWNTAGASNTRSSEDCIIKCNLQASSPRNSFTVHSINLLLLLRAFSFAKSFKIYFGNFLQNPNASCEYSTTFRRFVATITWKPASCNLEKRSQTSLKFDMALLPKICYGDAGGLWDHHSDTLASYPYLIPHCEDPQIYCGAIANRLRRFL